MMPASSSTPEIEPVDTAQLGYTTAFAPILIHTCNNNNTVNASTSAAQASATRPASPMSTSSLSPSPPPPPPPQVAQLPNLNHHSSSHSHVKKRPSVRSRSHRADTGVAAASPFTTYQSRRLHYFSSSQRRLSWLKKGAAVFSRSAALPLALHKTPNNSDLGTLAGTASSSAALSDPSTSTDSFIYDPALPTAFLPPVNTCSLKEIDLQEVFKNPQLRHDVVFDQHLQFRPNSLGDRGQRKRQASDRYWDAITDELQAMLNASESARDYKLREDAKLPYLFMGIREILETLLPEKDRLEIDEVLDADLIISQMSHCAFDFSAMAVWLASVFKAHCAPMRDTAVEVMVNRVTGGMQAKNMRRVAEGLRSVFFVLEAMKLDVANHQIRTLRPVLIDSAVSFEQGYYQQIIDRKKFSLKDTTDWYAKNLSNYKREILKDESSTSWQTFVSGFCYGLTMLLSCASEDKVTEFPSVFHFDATRLSTFRVELRQIVCMHLCVMLYQTMLRQALMDKPNRQALATAAFTPSVVEELKRDLTDIISDSCGTAKWTKYSSTAALELARRVKVATAPKSSTAATAAGSVIPDKSMIDMAENWLATHIQPTSPIYKLIETRVLHALTSLTTKSMHHFTGPDQPPVSLAYTPPAPKPNTQPMRLVPLTVDAVAQKEISGLAGKLTLLARFHWAVFGKYYVSSVTLGTEDYAAATGLQPLVAVQEEEEEEEEEEETFKGEFSLN